MVFTDVGPLCLSYELASKDLEKFHGSPRSHTLVNGITKTRTQDFLTLLNPDKSELNLLTVSRWHNMMAIYPIHGRTAGHHDPEAGPALLCTFT